MTACDFASIRCFNAARKASSANGTSGMSGEIHILARDRRARRDEARVAPHELHQSDPTRNAARLGVRAIEHARRFLDRAEKSERPRDEADVVVDRLRHADDRQGVAALARFLVKLVPSAPGCHRHQR